MAVKAEWHTRDIPSAVAVRALGQAAGVTALTIPVLSTAAGMAAVAILMVAVPAMTGEHAAIVYRNVSYQ